MKLGFVYDSSKEMQECREGCEKRVITISNELNELYNKFGFIVFDILKENIPYLTRRTRNRDCFRGGYS